MLVLDLLNEVDRLQRGVNHLFGNGWAPHPKAQTPAVNVWRNDDEIQLTAELPGIDVNQLDVSVQGNQLTLKGAYPQRELREGETWLRQERPSHAFIRTLELPFQVEAEKVDAKYAHGVLTLTLPRAEAEKPKRIEIKAAA
jgi:HSP20 family protein